METLPLNINGDIMKILMLCHNVPSPYRGDTLRPFNLIKFLSKKYNYKITLLCFKKKGSQTRECEHTLKKYCHVIPPVEIKNRNGFISTIMHTIKNTLCLQNILSGNISFLNYYYSAKIQDEINKLLKTENFDAIYTDGGMAHYVYNNKLPKIVEPLDAISENTYELFLNENNRLKKMMHWMQYIKAKNRERQYQQKFNYCNVVTQKDKRILQPQFQISNVEVVPNGVDLSYFKPLDIQEDFPSLIFIGVMNTSKNINSMHYFYNNVYPRILKINPNVKLYIVGANPSKEILQLSSNNIIVTGYVDDIRKYLAKSTIVIVPMKEGTGIKNKVLEAMAMRKPVVTTSIGAMGIEIIPNENIVIADEPDKFATNIIELLADERLRKNIANNGRKLVESRYSWEIVADEINAQYERIVH
ncbi:sugar transferase (PEP-CTERM/EpsH1 system associated) [Methanohalophilus euhalobius]|uniref:Sugar transferase (PEP-CTERM/EpsH1 system associated) n=1 Tax=Methanohalophilus euhalobius TaxID=51203 RepID=A0A285GBU6_9EURY|nr:MULTISPECIES: glycosyltransferase family 4 protein [Methanohalophilus]ODV48847.1 MAG: glycosyltransferase [Methanohalophilus sp. 2-GBenrich]TCL11596.1 sugar transferase (PEP-CTERM/EpsH1 system associated) [Methanohalophilus euhalobius]SNY20654.1 sugar transferase, PEP-CTERM/EpsH1 system associated [Methanohalophilus euhalobius]